MQKPFFSIIVVSLNPGERLRKTLESILGQTFCDYEVILKDGGSTDGSLEALKEEGFFREHPQICVIEKKDTGIYDGMNQAAALARGRYLQFLNCGDYFYDHTVLAQTVRSISQDLKEEDSEKNGKKNENISNNDDLKIYYGNQYNRLQDTFVPSAPKITDFTCYRNVPCHQVCFYDARLFSKRSYDTKYRVRADYEHFLYSIYKEKAKGIYVPITVVSYEGGGFSESNENKNKSAAEHREITLKYMGRGRVLKYRMILWLTLAPLRTKIAENPALAGVYNRLKQGIYKM